MKRHDRRVLANCVLFGTLVTASVVAMDLTGLLGSAENWMYDQRARHFQFFQPPPTDRLVHLDIDDKALDAIGRWPWPRTQMAQIVDELNVAGAKAIGMDILFADRQRPDFQPRMDDDGAKTFVESDHDASFAASIVKAKDVILPASFELRPPSRDPFFVAAVEELTRNIEQDDRQLAAVLSVRFPTETSSKSGIMNLFLKARSEAVYLRVEKELSSGPLTSAQLRKRLIIKADAALNSPLTREIDEQRDRYDAITQLKRFGIASPSSGDLFVPADVKVPVITPLARGMAATAFVDFTFTLARDGVLRTQPLLLESGGRIYPQMGLALAMKYLDATPTDLAIAPDSISILGVSGQKFVIPTSTYFSDNLNRPVRSIFYIPWFGGKSWETMYDWPAHAKSAQHLSVNAVYENVLTLEKIQQNNASADLALRNWALFRGVDPGEVPKNNIATSRLKDLKKFIEDASSTGILEMFKDVNPADTSESDRLLIATLKAYNNGKPDEKLVAALPKQGKKIVDDLYIARYVLEQNPGLGKQLETNRKKLRDQIQDRAVLIGWTATGHQDAVPTSLHAQCPGVVAHGAIFNAIITQRFWSVAPAWITIALTLALGAITAVFAWKFSPLKAFVITSVLGVGYVALNGLYFFDHLNWIVGLAAPQVAMGGVWAGCSLGRIVIEQAERARVTKRLGSYTDPRLVSYVLEKEDDNLLKGETRELTVCFSDIAGFTTLAEKLGQEIVPILNEYLTLMVPIIRAQGGYVNKFLGDGIMFFFGAPYPTDRHAEQAVETALLMQRAIVQFNQSLANRGLPPVKVRIGINTGEMVVGDAGAHDAADYTVLGDNVNFASRLESGNKQLGTLILMSARTAELAGDRFLIRPIGALQVVGKSEGVMTYSLTGYVADADDADRRWVEWTKKMVDSFRAKEFITAREAADTIEAEFGESILPGLYRNLCKFYTDNPPADPFDGKIVFTEK